MTGADSLLVLLKRFSSLRVYAFTCFTRLPICIAGNAYNRMVSQGATYSPKTRAAPTVGQKNLTGVGKGLPITGWECPSGWVSGDGNSTKANTRCQRTCV